MIEFFVTSVVGLVLASGVYTEVVEPTASYVIDQGKAGYEYVQEKLD
jgi:hypothetical protein